MNKHFYTKAGRITIAGILCIFGILLQKAWSQPYIAVEVSGSTPVEIFKFSTSAGQVPENHMVVANFLVDDISSDLVFNLVVATPDPDYPNTTSFSTGASFPGTKPLEDDNGDRIFQARARDLTPDLPTNQKPIDADGDGVPDYRIIKLRIEFEDEYTYPAKDWSVRIQPVSGATKVFRGFWTEGDGADFAIVETNLTAEVSKPHFSLLDQNGDPTTSIDFGRVQTNLQTDLRPIVFFKIFNNGTAPLHPVAPPTISAPFFRSSDWVWSLPLKPGQTTDLPSGPSPINQVVIGFKPTDRGEGSANEGSVTINGADSGGSLINPAQLQLLGTGITTDVILLLDTSGSMCFSPSDTSGEDPGDCVAKDKSRMWQAKQSTFEVFQAYKGLTEGGNNRFGLYTFPDWRLSNHDWNNQGTPATARKEITIGNTDAKESSLQTATGSATTGIQPVFNATPMAKGIEFSQEDLRTDDDYYARLIVLLSDGNHNKNSDTFPRTPEDWIPTLKSKEIRVYPVAYGLPGKSSTDHGLLQKLADETGVNEIFTVDPEKGFTEPEGIKKNFQQVMTKFLGLNPVADPSGELAPGGNATHEVCIESSAQTMTVLLDWDSNQQNAIGLTLEGPSGQVITPTSPGVFYRHDNTYALYVVKPAHMAGRKGAGKWRLRLSGNNDSVLKYSYSVLTQSPQTVKSNFSIMPMLAQGGFVAELDMREAFAVKVPLVPRPPLRMDIVRPLKSFGTYLADAPIDPRWILGESMFLTHDADTTTSDSTALKQAPGKGVPHVPDIIMGEKATLAQKKLYALIHFANMPFVQEHVTDTVTLYDDGTHGDRVKGDFIYAATTPALSVDGIYNFKFTLDAVLGNDCLQRDIRITKYLPIALTSEGIISATQMRDVWISDFMNPELKKILQDSIPKGYLRKSVVFTPQDQFGNKIGPGHDVKFAVEGGEILGQPVDNLDGSYIQVIQYEKSHPPKVSVTAQGVTAPIDVVEETNYRLWIIIGFTIAVLVLILAALLRKMVS